MSIEDFLWVLSALKSQEGYDVLQCQALLRRQSIGESHQLATTTHRTGKQGKGVAGNINDILFACQNTRRLLSGGFVH